MSDRRLFVLGRGAVTATLIATSLLAVPGAAAIATDRPILAASPYVVIVGSGPADTPAGALQVARDQGTARDAERVVRGLGLRPDRLYASAVHGFAARLSGLQVAALQADPRVRAVVPDRVIRGERDEAGAGPGGEAAPVRTTALAAQVVPAGIRRVRADLSPIARIDGQDTRIDVDVAILDSGIADHRDLAIAGGYDCVSPFPDAWRDRYGHGTHVAGIVAAIDDGAGVVGVAPGARLWAVKILDDNDMGTLSSFLCGIDWVMGQRDPLDPTRPLIEVANMSVSSRLTGADDRDCGTPAGDAVHMAICASVADGTTYVAAAGNQGYDARDRLPAAYDEVITVSAMADYDGRPGGSGDQDDVCDWTARDADDAFAGFSNYGADVDIMAPGKCILSTFLGKRWAWMSGTSMATPTVAGAAALYISEHPGVRPGQVRQALRHKATLDWLVETDPDGDPDPLLDVAQFAPPPDFRVQAAAPTDLLAPGGLLEIPLGVVRMHGHDAPLALVISGLPAGVSASLVAGSTDEPGLVLRATAGAVPRSMDVRIWATDGELSRGSTVPVEMAAGPVIEFSGPPSGTPVVSPDDSVEVAWREAGSPAPVMRGVRREHAPPVTAGECRDVRWAAEAPVAVDEVDPDGSRASGWTFQASDFPADGCFRWVVTLTDDAQRDVHWASPAVIVDSTPPEPPDVVASGAGVWQGASNGTIWVRAGSGSLNLSAIGVDMDGGVVSSDFGPLTGGSGWTFSPGLVDGDPAVARLTWGPAAVDTSLDVISTDAAGLTGTPRRVRLLVDATLPAPPTWDDPATGTFAAEFEAPGLEWLGATDVGSGLAAEQLIQRRRAAVVTAGSCSGVRYANDGPARLLGRLHEDADLLTGHCYRWRLTARDRVGNLGGSVVSGSVLFDDIAPVGDFLAPDEGTVRTRTKTTLRLRWTQQDAGGSARLTQQVERERARAPEGGGCDSLRWRLDGATSGTASPLLVSGLKAGWCYRWRLVLEDGAANVTTVISGAVRIESGVSSSLRTDST
ncbi:MAG: S8 family serine peptidase [Chloroflexota bacterium]|nr:S8 family serine peptidase [Chloroflexota bacterium]